MYGEYEHSRDVDKYPACWMAENDACMPHFHSSVEIVYLLSGQLEVAVDGRPYLIEKNQVLISPSYSVHYYVTPQRSESIVLVVPLDFVPSFRREIRKKTFAKNVYQDSGPGSQIYGSMQALASCCAYHSVSAPGLAAKGHLYVVLGELTEHVGLIDAAGAPDSSLAREILLYLQDNYLSTVTLASLAQEFGYSKSRFSHIFNDCFGCSITEYVNTLRCRSAAALFADESASMIDAAMNSGFESMRSFYRCFKQCFGMTPSEYRRGIAQTAKAPQEGPERRVKST